MTTFFFGIIVGSTIGAFTVAIFAAIGIKQSVAECEMWKQRHDKALAESRHFEAALNGRLHGQQN